jgi:hypothetical protein
MTDVKNHRNDDVQTRLLPLQWAIDSVSGNNDSADVKTFIESTTGTRPTPPLSWEYTTQTQANKDQGLRLCKLYS